MSSNILVRIIVLSGLIGAATHDIGIGVQRGMTKWIHRIDPQIDQERHKIGADLLFAEAVQCYSLVERPELSGELKNDTGDSIATDGQMLVIQLKQSRRTVALRATAGRSYRFFSTMASRPAATAWVRPRVFSRRS